MQASGYSDDDKSVHSDDDQRSDQSREVSGDEDGQRSEPENDDDQKDSSSKPDKKPKKKGPVRRVLLSEDELTGKNGLLKLQEMFSNFTFKGKGHEKQDLDLMLYRYEQWTHVLFPKHPFAQLLERIEVLGAKKRAVKVHLKKIRMGLINNDGNEDVLSEPEMVDERQNSDAENVPPENPDTWSRIKANSEVIDKTGDWPNDDAFPDDDDDIFATIDMGDENTGVIQPVPEDASNLTTRTRHSSVSSIDTDTSKSDVINSPVARSIMSRQHSSRKGSESPRSDVSQSSTSAMSASQLSKKSFSSPSSVRSKSSSSTLSTKPKNVKRKSRLRAIMEDSDSDNDLKPATKPTTLSSSDSEPDDSKASGSKFSKTIMSSDEEEEPSHSRNLGDESARSTARRIVSSDDSDDDDANVPVRLTSSKGDSSDDERNPIIPQSSTGSSHSPISNPKRDKLQKNTQFFEQTTMVVSGTSCSADPKGVSKISFDHSDASEDESSTVLEMRKHGKRPRSDSSEDELGLNTSRGNTLRRRRVVSDSDDD